MKRLAGLAIATVLLAVAVFDVGRESRETLGLGPVLILLAFGVIMWLLINKLSTGQAGETSTISVRAALWSHSLFEGALAALSFEFGLRSGLIICGALLLHILPESLAVIAYLRQMGQSTSYAIKTYLISVAILATSFIISVLTKPSEMPLTILATLVAGGFIYLAISSSRKVFQTTN